MEVPSMKQYTAKSGKIQFIPSMEATMEMEKVRRRLLRTASSKDAMNMPAHFPQTGSWASARGARSGRERGKVSRLTG